MIKKLAASTLFIFLFLAGCDPFEKDALDFYERVESTHLSMENVHSFFLNSHLRDVIDTFGEPLKVEMIENPKSKYIKYDRIEFGLADDKVFRLFIYEGNET